eukprot:977843-Pleurochrysis_carterae.AAC.1
MLRNKRKEASTLQKRIGVTLDQRDKARAVEQGVLKGRFGDSATAAGAELFAIFAILRKVQAKQDMRHHGNEKARILIMSDCLLGLRTMEKVWRGRRNMYRKLQNGAVLEAITNVREKLGTVIFMWIPSHVGIIPNVMADSIAALKQEAAPEGMVTGLISKQEGDGTHGTGGYTDLSGSWETGEQDYTWNTQTPGRRGHVRERSGQGADRWRQYGGRRGLGYRNGHRKTGKQEGSGKICTRAQEWRDSRGTGEGKKNETRHERRE